MYVYKALEITDLFVGAPDINKKGENGNIMKRYEVTDAIQGFTENECYKELWCAVILQAVFDLESENEKYRESALYFLKSFDFGRMILKKKGVNIDGK